MFFYGLEDDINGLLSKLQRNQIHTKQTYYTRLALFNYESIFFKRVPNFQGCTDFRKVSHFTIFSNLTPMVFAFALLFFKWVSTMNRATNITP